MCCKICSAHRNGLKLSDISLLCVGCLDARLPPHMPARDVVQNHQVVGAAWDRCMSSELVGTAPSRDLLAPPQTANKRRKIVSERASDGLLETGWLDAVRITSDVKQYGKYRCLHPPQVLLGRANLITDRASDWCFELTLPWCPASGPQSRHFQKHRMVPPQVMLKRANIITDRASDWLFEVAVRGLQAQKHAPLVVPLQSEDVWEMLADRGRRPRIQRGVRLLSPHFKVCPSCRPQLDNVRGRWAQYATCLHRVAPARLPMMPEDAPPLPSGKKARMTHRALVRRGEMTKKKKGLARCRHGLRERACAKCSGCPHSKLRSRCNLCRKNCPHGKYVRHCKTCSGCPHGLLRDACKQCRGHCEHGSLRSACKLCSGCPHGRLKHACRLCRPCPHGRLRINCQHCKNCGHGKVREHCAKCNPCPHGAVKYTCVKCNGCEHGKLPRFCKACKPCPHGKRASHCPHCAGCSHGLLPSNCKQCSGCPHGRVKRFCRECNPCPHGKRKQACLQCSSCPHGKIKYSCPQCKSCQHGKVRRFCKQCNGCPHGKLARFCEHCKVAKQPKVPSRSTTGARSC